MDIQGDPQSVETLFLITSKRLIKVPAYQRAYSWEREPIVALFDDINNEIPPYYVGNIIQIKSIRTDNPRIVDMEIVDGQQRLTTIAMFLLGIYQLFEEFSDAKKLDDEGTEAKGAIQNDIKRMLIVDSVTRLQLLESDQLVWEKLTDSILRKTSTPLSIDRRVKFYKRYQLIFEYLKENLRSVDEIKKFHDSLLQAEFFVLRVSDLSAAYSIFSSLNSKGQPLTLIDLLKTEYLRLSADENNGEPVIEHWNELLKIFSDAASNVNTPTQTQFLQNNYDAFESQETSSITKGQSLKKYQDLFDQNGSQYIFEIIQHARFYSEISPKLEPASDLQILHEGNLKTLLQQLKVLDSTTSFPLLLKLIDLLAKQVISIPQFEHSLTLLVAFYVRRNISKVPKSSNIRSAFLKLLRDTNNTDDWPHIVDRLQTLLSSLSPKDPLISEQLKRPIYMDDRQLARFLLININRKIGKATNPKEYGDTFDEIDERSKAKGWKWTIEHILPETDTLTPEWQQSISPNAPEQAKDLQDEYVHQIGNLTLTGHNAEMSNRSFRDKVEYANAQGNRGLNSGIEINASILDKGETWETKNDWSIADITRRTKWFADMVNKFYPFPH